MYLKTLKLGGSKKISEECNRVLQMMSRRNHVLSKISKHLSKWKDKLSDNKEEYQVQILFLETNMDR